MPLAPLNTMTFGEIVEYVEAIEAENKSLRAKTDNAHKLSDAEVRRIRSLWDTKNWTQLELGNAFGVNKGTISRIVRREYHAAV